MKDEKMARNRELIAIYLSHSFAYTFGYLNKFRESGEFMAVVKCELD